MLDVNMVLLQSLLRQAYNELGSYESLASKIGTDRGSLWRIMEKGQKPTLETLNRISSYLRIATADLLMGEVLIKLNDLPKDVQDIVTAVWFKRNSDQGQNNGSEHQ